MGNDFLLVSQQWDQKFQARRWVTELPCLKFPTDWKFKIIPPFSMAVIRFQVTTDRNPSRVISVYFDGYGCLGSVGSPYWEIYPDKNGDNRRYLMNDTEGLLNGIRESLEQE